VRAQARGREGEREGENEREGERGREREKGRERRYAALVRGLRCALLLIAMLKSIQ
jgi:hypothetical protein